MSIPKIKIRKFNPEILETRRIHGSPPTVVVIGKRGCMVRNTPLIMADSKIKMVQEIKIGDKLMGDDSQPRTVLALCQGTDKMYKIKQKAGMEYIVNGDHILSLKMTYVSNSKSPNTHRIILGKKYKKGEVVDIKVYDYLKLSNGQKAALKGFKVPVVFPTKDIPLDPYIIGLWLGDGSSRNTVNKLPEYNCYLQHQGHRESNIYQYRMKGITEKSEYYHNSIKQALTELNLINNKHIPDIYKFNDRNNQLKLLAGIIDTDGYYSHKTGCYDIIQKNYTLAKDIEFIARCLGFTANVTECKKKSQTGTEGTYYRQSISGMGLRDIPCLIPRKQTFCQIRKENNLHTGITIEPMEEDTYYGFQLDGNQRFLLGDFTVTHNSGKSTLISDLLWHVRKIPMFICMSGTEEGNGFYGKYMHPLLIHGEYKKDIVSNLIKQQKAKLKKCLRAGIEPNSRPDLGTGLLLDDCGFNRKIMNQEDMRLLFMNGRHWKICFIVSLQYMMGIPPDLRTNIDFVFCLRENIAANQKKLYDNFFGCFKKFAHFQEAFNECTNNYECLVLDNTSKSTKVEDCVFYYKATPNRDYKLGSRDLWNYLDSRYKEDCDSDGEDGDKVQSSVVIKKAPMVRIIQEE